MKIARLVVSDRLKKLAAMAVCVGFALGLATGSQAAEFEPGSYTLDPTHTNVIFGIDHLGFSTYYGRFNEIAGTLDLNEDPPKSALSVTIKSASVDSNSDHLYNGLIADKMFDAANYPEITFVSTSIEQADGTTGTVTGDLTIKEVTKPVTLDVTFNAGAVNPFSKSFTVGFGGTTTIKRSEFGLNEWIAIGVGDEVTLQIQAEFNKAAPEAAAE